MLLLCVVVGGLGTGDVVAGALVDFVELAAPAHWLTTAGDVDPVSAAGRVAERRT